MANRSNIAPLQASAIDPRAIEVRITCRCRDVLVRSDLEATYLARFVRAAGTSVIYALTVDEIASLLDVLKSRRGDVKHYDKVAVTALVRELERLLLIERTRGLAPVPASDGAYLNLLYGQIAKATGSPACLQIGDRMIDSFGDIVTVDGAYGLYQCTTERGRFYDQRGERVDFILGYGICTSDGGSLAVKPCELMHIDGRQSYLQLVDGGQHD